MYALYNLLVAFNDFKWIKLAWRSCLIIATYWLFRHIMKNNLDLLKKANRGVVCFFIIVKLVSISVTLIFRKFIFKWTLIDAKIVEMKLKPGEKDPNLWEGELIGLTIKTAISALEICWYLNCVNKFVCHAKYLR